MNQNTSQAVALVALVENSRFILMPPTPQGGAERDVPQHVVFELFEVGVCLQEYHQQRDLAVREQGFRFGHEQCKGGNILTTFGVRRTLLVVLAADHNEAEGRALDLNGRSPVGGDSAQKIFSLHLSLRENGSVFSLHHFYYWRMTDCCHPFCRLRFSFAGLVH